MANGWGSNGNSDRLYFPGLQNNCRWWLQPWNEKTLAPWTKSYDQTRQHIEKQRHYFAKRGLSSQSYGFSSSHVWMWELDYNESWASKIWCFWTVVLEKTLESLLDWKNQLIIKEISPEYSLEGLMLKLKLQFFGHLMWRTDSVEKTLMLGKIEGRRRRGRQRMRWLVAPLTRWKWVWATSRSWWWTGRPGVLQSMGSQRVRHDWVSELNWLTSCVKECAWGWGNGVLGAGRKWCRAALCSLGILAIA